MAEKNKIIRCKAYYNSLAQLCEDGYVRIGSCNKGFSSYLIPFGTDDQLSYYGKPELSFRLSDHWNWYSNLKKCKDESLIQCCCVCLPGPSDRIEEGKASRAVKACCVAFYYKGAYYTVYGELFDAVKKEWYWLETKPRDVFSLLTQKKYDELCSLCKKTEGYIKIDNPHDLTKPENEKLKIENEKLQIKDSKLEKQRVQRRLTKEEIEKIKELLSSKTLTDANKKLDPNLCKEAIEALYLSKAIPDKISYTETKNEAIAEIPGVALRVKAIKNLDSEENSLDVLLIRKLLGICKLRALGEENLHHTEFEWIKTADGYICAAKHSDKNGKYHCDIEKPELKLVKKPGLFSLGKAILFASFNSYGEQQKEIEVGRKEIKEKKLSVAKNAFCRYTASMNEELEKLQDSETEFVSDELIAEAVSYINCMSLKRPGDILLYCAALNLCNRYVKQKDAKINYYFKTALVNVIEALNSNCIEDVYIDIQKDMGMTLLLVQAGHVQFSFHGVEISERLLNAIRLCRNTRTISWQDVRKQRCAVSCFELAKANIIGRTNLTTDYKELSSEVRKAVSDIMSGKLKLAVKRNH